MTPKPEVEDHADTGGGLPASPEVEADLSLADSIKQIVAFRGRILHLKRQQFDIDEALKRVGYSGTSGAIDHAMERLLWARKNSSKLLEGLEELGATMDAFERNLTFYHREMVPVRAAVRRLRDERQRLQSYVRNADKIEKIGTEQLRITLGKGISIAGTPDDQIRYETITTRTFEAIEADLNTATTKMKSLAALFTHAQDQLNDTLTQLDIDPVPFDESPVEVTIDPGNVPPGVDIDDLKRRVERMYQQSYFALTGDSTDTPTKIHLILGHKFDDDDPAAATTTYDNGVTTIRMGSQIDWNDPEGAMRTLAHEVTHVAQRADDNVGAGLPSWVVEGMADHVTLYDLEAQTPRLNLGPDPDGKTWDAGYENTAQMIEWIRTTHEPQIMNILRDAGHDGTYTDQVFLDATGANSMDELWRQFAAERGNVDPGPVPIASIPRDSGTYQSAPG